MVSFENSDITIRPIRDDEWEVAFYVIRELRRDLDLQTFLERVDRQKVSGYRLIGAFLECTLIAALGFRTLSTLARGFHMHIDDLVVASNFRGRGTGRALLRWAEEKARSEGIDKLFLDSRTEVVGWYRGLGYEPHTAVLMRKRIG